MSTPVAEFVGVSKTYTSGLLKRRMIQAATDITCRVEPGEVFGLLGPNRAGKTTLIKVLLSLCRPTKGQAFRFGQPVADRRTLAKVGYMHENHAMPRYLSAEEILAFYGALALVPEAEVRRRVPALLQRVELSGYAREPISRFSKGMVQRLALAQALINDPELLVLDEPSEGLDLNGRRLLRDIITDYRRQGRSVILVSHVLTEAEKLCDRLAVVFSGRLIHTSTVADLTRTESGTRPLEHALQELYREKGPA